MANCIAKRRMARTTIVVRPTGRYANETADELRLKMVIVEPEQTGADRSRRKGRRGGTLAIFDDTLMNALTGTSVRSDGTPG